MKPFPFALAQGENLEDLLDSCLAQLGSLPADANLGFLYATDQLARQLADLVSALRQAYPRVHWVGTLGDGICAGSQEIYETAAVAVMVGSFPVANFGLLRETPRGPVSRMDPPAWLLDAEPLFALLHADPSNPETAAWLQTLAQHPDRPFINGGITSSQGAQLQVFDGVISGGISGVLFGSEVELITDHTQGCSPIGPVHQLSRSDENLLISIDERPALEVMREEMGEVLSRDLQRAGGYIFAALPISGSDSGDYLVRNLIGIDEASGVIAVGDYLQDQQQIMFCRRDGNSARQDMQHMLDRLKRRLIGRQIRGGIYVSCLGRGRYQFGPDSEELGMISASLGPFPLVGFFANGELYNGRIYGYTGVLTLFL
jgi:small ligand-binding sensory domain FIST